MNTSASLQQQLTENGFAISNRIFDDARISNLLQTITAAKTERATFRQSNDLFAIRQFLKELPDLVPIIFYDGFIKWLQAITGPGYFVVKSIYFDKPPQSNWFVAFHQDLTISVDKKAELEGFGPWTVKQEQYAVQPPLYILEDNITVRIHLDDTNEENGALKVIPGSHRNGITRAAEADLSQAVCCPVAKGGIMLMKPLLLHASGRTINNERRRVIHIELSRQPLPGTLQWAEAIVWP